MQTDICGRTEEARLVARKSCKKWSYLWVADLLNGVVEKKPTSLS